MDALQVAYSEKSSGNSQFHSGQLAEACKSYSKALLAVNQVFRNPEPLEEEPMNQLVQEVQIPSLLNLALCYLKLGTDLQNAVTHCSSVLQIDPGNVKGYYRRAQAYLALQEFPSARSDLISALNLDPGNASLKECWQELQQKEQRYREKSKRIAQAALSGDKAEGSSVSRELMWGLFRCCRRRIHEASLRR